MSKFILNKLDKLKPLVKAKGIEVHITAISNIPAVYGLTDKLKKFGYKG